jgi:hypothetical protein
MRATIAAEQEKQKPKSPQKPRSPVKNQQRSPGRQPTSPPKKVEPKNQEMNELQGQISDAIVREKPNVKW